MTFMNRGWLNLEFRRFGSVFFLINRRVFRGRGSVFLGFFVLLYRVLKTDVFNG